MTYAVNTKVSPASSRVEIERILQRYGATGFLYGWAEGSAVVAFEMSGRRVKFVLPILHSAAFTQTETGRERGQAAVTTAHEQAIRQRWRALALAIKAKLEIVESGITEFDEEFLAHIVLPGGERIGDWLAPQLERVFSSGQMPPLLPAPSSK